jgi:integrase
LAKLIEDKQSHEPLFPGLTKDGLLYWTTKLCAKAGLPRVTPHGLRGTHATASMKPHTNPNEVAAALGHANIGVTLRHYADLQAVADAKQEAAASALLSKSSSKTFGHASQKHEGPTEGPGQLENIAS